MIVKIRYPRQDEPTKEERLRIKMLREAVDGGADITHVDNEFLAQWAEPEDSPRFTLIECDSINVRETEDSWGFTPYKDGDAISHYDFPMEDGVCAYVLEKGTTADRLPRR